MFSVFVIWVDYTATHRDGASMGLTTKKKKLDVLGPIPSPAPNLLQVYFSTAPAEKPVQ